MKTQPIHRVSAPAALAARLITVAAVLALPAPLNAGAATASPQEEDAPRVEALERRATDAFERADFETAHAALTDLLEHKPKNPAVHYNLACALAQTGRTEAGAERLVDAISWGFVDFFHMSRDPHLAPIRDGQTYQTVLLSWRDLLDARAESAMSVARERFGGGYTYEKDAALRVQYVSAFDQRTFAEARAEIRRVSDWAMELLFTALDYDTPEQSRPDPWVTILLPTPEDFVRIVQTPNVGGYYDHDRRRLISQDVGPSFRHEFFHVLHWRDMTRRGQRHPEWIMEGLGALVEDVEFEEDGGLTPVPSWRTNIVKRLERGGRLLGWNELMTMPRKRFVTRRPNAHYAQARAVMMFLQERGRLGSWYRAYVDSFEEDPSGVAAFEADFDRPLVEIEREYAKWVRDLPEVAERIRPGMASLGVVVTPGRGDGPTISRIERRARGLGLGLRTRDVITAVDDRPTRTMEDLVRILSEYEVGDAVEVTVRRGTRWLTVEATLIEQQPE